MSEIKEVKIIRVIDHDGMGGKTYEFHCGGCKVWLEKITPFCSQCGCKLGEVEKRDTWGLH